MSLSRLECLGSIVDGDIKVKIWAIFLDVTISRQKFFIFDTDTVRYANIVNYYGKISISM
jgi:hypothetical protein